MLPAVCIVIDTNQIGGPGKGIIQYLRHSPLKNLRHIVCTPRYPHRPEAPFARAVMAAGFELLYIDQKHGFDISALSQVVDLLNKNNCQLVQTHGYKAHILGWWARRKLKIPWIAYSHGWTSENLKVRIYNQVERVLLPHADHVVAVSKPLFESTKKWRGNDGKTSLILNAVDRNEIPHALTAAEVRAQCGIDASCMLIGFIGRLSQEKGIKFLLLAYAELLKSSLNSHLILIGNGPEKGNLTALARSLNISQNITFLPHQDALAGFFESIDILALPSLSEGLPNVVLEAMAFGKAVVASSVGSVPDVITNDLDGILVQPGNVKNLLGALYELCHDDKKRSQIGRLALKTAQDRFDATKRAQAIADIYKKYIKNLENSPD